MTHKFGPEEGDLLVVIVTQTLKLEAQLVYILGQTFYFILLVVQIETIALKLRLQLLHLLRQLVLLLNGPSPFRRLFGRLSAQSSHLEMHAVVYVAGTSSQLLTVSGDKLFKQNKLHPNQNILTNMFCGCSKANKQISYQHVIEFNWSTCPGCPPLVVFEDNQLLGTPRTRPKDSIQTCVSREAILSLHDVLMSAK